MTRLLPIRVAATAVVAMMTSMSAMAHGLLLKLDAEGAHVRGTAYFTNGDVAADEWVEWIDLDATDTTPVGHQSDAEGRFEFDGRQGHRYRVRAYAEEGHTVELELTLAPDSRPKLVDEAGETINPWWPPPAWMVIGGLLLASIPFARFHRNSIGGNT